VTRRGFAIAVAHPKLNLRGLAFEDGEYLGPLQHIFNWSFADVEREVKGSLWQSRPRIPRS